jgi:hypothetical protein
VRETGVVFAVAGKDRRIEELVDKWVAEEKGDRLSCHVLFDSEPTSDNAKIQDLTPIAGFKFDE